MKYLVIILTALINTCIRPSAFAAAPEILGQPLDCGTTTETGDIRTRAPWIVSIYIRLGGNSRKVKFLTTGLVTTPTVVTSHFGGTLGFPPGRYKGYYWIPKPESFLIVAGLNSTNLNNIDQFTEFANVEHVQPYSGLQEDWKQFHYVLFHLKSPLHLSQYVKPPCFRFPDKIRELEKMGKFRSLYPDNVLTDLYGHSFPSKKGHYEIRTLKVNIIPGVECAEIYRSHYNTTGILPSALSCARAIDTGSAQPICLQPNCVRMDKIFGGKLFITGSTIMVPDRKTNVCTKSTVYFVYLISEAEADWYAKSLRCSQYRKYACFKGNQCIDWSNVCDFVKHCENGEDEDKIYCDIKHVKKRTRNPSLILS